MVSIAQQKTDDSGEIFKRRAAAWLPVEQVGGPDRRGGSLLPGCAGFDGGGKEFPQRGICSARGSKAAAGNTRKSKGTELLGG